MAIGDPLQWIIIGIIVVVIFLWGPQKIPELARGLGRAKGEFDRATKEFESASKQAVAPGPGDPTGQVSVEKSGDQILMETARALGIDTAGKTREQISQEIISKKSDR